MVSEIVGIAVGILLIIILVILIIKKTGRKDRRNGTGNSQEKIVVNQRGVDVESGKLGSKQQFLGMEQDKMDTVCMSQELLQQQYYMRSRHIRLTECETGHVWDSSFSSDIYLGRLPHPQGKASIVISYSGVSKIHSHIYFDGSKYMIEDCGSTNGTYLNSNIIDAPRQLHTGDILILGKKKFQVMLQ